MLKPLISHSIVKINLCMKSSRSKFSLIPKAPNLERTMSISQLRQSVQTYRSSYSNSFLNNPTPPYKFNTTQNAGTFFGELMSRGWFWRGGTNYKVRTQGVGAAEGGGKYQKTLPLLPRMRPGG